MGKHKRKFSFQSADLVGYVWSNRKMLLTISVLAAIISGLVSLAITPRFRSTVVLFPASSASVSHALLSGNDDFLKFGTEEEGEQLMQILQSTRIRDKIIQRFHIARHYGIDTTSKFWRANLYDQYYDNVRVRRTEYMSIIIDVLDYNRDTAALIANEISAQVDTVVSQIQNERAKNALAIIEKEYQAKVHQMAEIEDSLLKLRRLGIINFKAQSKALDKAYADALLHGSPGAREAISKQLKLLAEYGGAYESLSDLQKIETEKLSSLHAKYMESKVDAEQTVSHKFVVDKAYPADKKAYPKRLLIILVSTISAFFLALFLLILKDSIKEER